jgi:hypothetical protein
MPAVKRAGWSAWEDAKLYTAPWSGAQVRHCSAGVLQLRIVRLQAGGYVPTVGAGFTSRTVKTPLPTFEEALGVCLQLARRLLREAGRELEAVALPEDRQDDVDHAAVAPEVPTIRPDGPAGGLPAELPGSANGEAGSDGGGEVDL